MKNQLIQSVSILEAHEGAPSGGRGELSIMNPQNEDRMSLSRSLAGSKGSKTNFKELAHRKDIPTWYPPHI
jgi:hypothetical protein